MENKNINIDLETVINKALESPAVKVNRNDFLIESFKDEEIDLSLVLDVGPVNATYPRDMLAAKAKALVAKRIRTSSLISFAAGLPGGAALGLTIPADVMQYAASALRLSQELAYLYGADDLFEGENGIEAARAKLILCCGALFGVDGGDSALRLFTARAQFGGIDPEFSAMLIKHIGTDVTGALAKNSAVGGAAKIIPLLGGVVSGGVTYTTLKPMGEHLSAVLDEALFDYDSEKLAADIANVRSVVDVPVVEAEAAGSEFVRNGMDELRRGMRGLGDAFGSMLSELRTRVVVEPDEEDIYITLRRLGELHEDGILTDEEFAAKKAELLKKL